MRPIGNGRPSSGHNAPAKELGARARSELHRRGHGSLAAAPRGTGGIVRLPLGRQGSGRHGEVKDHDASA